MFLQTTKIYDRLRSIMLPLKVIDYAVPLEGNITELGCGQGVISKYLARNKKRQVIGIDSNAQRLTNPETKNLKFKVGDITKVNYKLQNAFVISDVMHHIGYAQQKRLLERLYKVLPKGGILVIKEIDRDEFLRSRMSRFWDFIFYPRDKISYQSAKDLKKYLTKLGFNVTLIRACRLFPGSTTLFLCKKNG